MSERIETYKNFYQFYLTEHNNFVCRTLHFTGTFLFFVMFFYILYSSKYRLFWTLPLIGYGFAWVGHFFFEKNKPATFKYPFWSLISDFKMFFDILLGKQRLNP